MIECYILESDIHSLHIFMNREVDNRDQNCFIGTRNSLLKLAIGGNAVFANLQVGHPHVSQISPALPAYLPRWMLKNWVSLSKWKSSYDA